MTAKDSLVTALRATAAEYQTEANTRHLVSDADALERAACTLRLAAVLVQERVYTLDLGYAWLDAGGRILNLIQDATVRSNA